MTIKQVERIVHRSPFQPFRLVLKDGEEVSVKRPHKAHVSGDQIALVGECKPPKGPIVERFRIINVDRVVSAEHLGNGRSRPY